MPGLGDASMHTVHASDPAAPSALVASHRRVRHGSLPSVTQPAHDPIAQLDRMKVCHCHMHVVRNADLVRP